MFHSYVIAFYHNLLYYSEGIIVLASNIEFKEIQLHSNKT